MGILRFRASGSRIWGSDFTAHCSLLLLLLVLIILLTIPILFPIITIMGFLSVLTPHCYRYVLFRLHLAVVVVSDTRSKDLEFRVYANFSCCEHVGDF